MLFGNELSLIIKDYDFEKRLCHGMSEPKKTDLKEWQVCLIKSMLPDSRKTMLKRFGDCNNRLGLFAGRSFNNDEMIVKRIESVEKSKWENISLGIVICDALYDCMRCDYWNEFEREREVEHERD